ncbi:MAG: alpha/beta hydrolase [Bacteroidota bacterium]
MDLAIWKNQGEYYAYNSHQIFYKDRGEGETLLLIHGFPTASWDWWQLWPHLTTRYRVLTLDMIGFGFSAKPPTYPYSIFDQADLIEQFLGSKDIDQVRILSHDYGDTVAQELLARFHERSADKQSGLTIESICFLNGGLFPETHQPLMIQKILMSPIGAIVGRRFTREKLGKNFKKIFGPDTQPTEKELDEFWELIAGNGGKKIFHLLIRYMRERKDNRDRWVSAIQQARIPLRLIDGVYDPISGQNIADRYKEVVPHPDVIELKNIGHFPLIEAPEEVLKYYLEFVQSS